MIIVTKFLRSCCRQATVGGNSSKDRWQFTGAATDVVGRFHASRHRL